MAHDPVFDMASGLHDLEPFHLANGLRCACYGILDSIVDALLGRSHEVQDLVDMILHLSCDRHVEPSVAYRLASQPRRRSPTGFGSPPGPLLGASRRLNSTRPLPALGRNCRKRASGESRDAQRLAAPQKVWNDQSRLSFLICLVEVLVSPKHGEPPGRRPTMRREGKWPDNRRKQHGTLWSSQGNFRESPNRARR